MWTAKALSSMTQSIVKQSIVNQSFMTQGFTTLSIVTLSIMVVSIMATGALAATFLVEPDGSGDYATIQAAIDAANNGDIVELADGLFTGNGNRDIRYHGKNITVRSQSGDPDNCVINVFGAIGNEHRGFIFDNNEGPGAVLQGITIMGAYYTATALDGGGGILCWQASPTIVGNVIGLNTAARGAGICLVFSSAIVSHNTIMQNDCILGMFGGGGIHADDFSSNVIISNNLITMNTSEHGGAGIHIACEGTIANNAIINNYAVNSGGGILCEDDPLIINNLVAYNLTDSGGGGIKVDGGYGSPLIINNTIVNNTASYRGGGIYSTGYPTVRNCIMWDNSCPLGPQLALGYSTNLTISYSDVQGGLSDVYVHPGCTLDWLDWSMHDAHPDFIAGPDGDYYLAQLAAGQYGDSPCVNAGSLPAADICFDSPGGTTCLNQLTTRTDLVPDTGQVDIGFHVVPAGASLVHHVDALGAGEYPTIQAAINAAKGGDTILLADGIYTGSGNRDVYYWTKAVTVRSASGDPAACVIDCQGSAADPHTGFVFTENEGPGSVLEGVTITNGYAAGIWPHDSGGAIRCDNTAPTVRNCVLRGNTATWGGGVYLYQSTPEFRDCLIHDNHATDLGGGFVCYESSPSIFYGTIVQNSAASDGGGVICYSTSNPLFANTIIGFNLNGMAVLCDEFASPTLTCCDVYGNAGGDWVGCIAEQQGTGGNLWADPLFCDAAADDFTLDGASPCAEANYPGCGRIGALPVGCSHTPTTYLVDPSGSGDFTTIQAGIDHAWHGDTLELSNATYSGPGNRDLDFQGKTITIRSQSGDPAACVIACGGSATEPHRAFNFHSGEGPGSVLRGVTITGAFNNNGGAMRIAGSSPTIQDCVFEDNEGFDGGAMLIFSGAAPTISGCRFENNHTTNSGGACTMNSANAVFENCEFYLNSATWGGGALYYYNSNDQVNGCVFAENSSDHWGGAVHVTQPGSAPNLQGCTFYANSAPLGGQLYVRENAQPTLDNCVLAFGSQGGAVHCAASGGAPALNCCDVFGNGGGDWIGCIADQLGVSGNFSDDPMFCDVLGFDFQLDGASPCAAVNNPTCGQIGALGVGCGIVTVVLQPDGSGAYPSIQAAIDAVPDGSVILLDDGTYTGSGNRDVNFNGKAVTVRSAGNNALYCIIDCQGSASDPHYGFRFASGEGLGSVLSDLTIRNGYSWDGGGVQCDNGSSPYISDCHFENNHAEDDGGGLFCHAGSNPNLSFCSFEGNTAVEYGGGMYCFVDCSPLIQSTWFLGNSAGNHGGGLCCRDNSSPIINGSHFNENTTAAQGGGLFCSDFSSPEMLICLFNDNVAADRGGGAAFSVNSFPEINFCGFSGNSANQGGGVSIVYSYGPMTGCRIYGNTANEGGGMYFRGNVQAVLNRCTIVYNTATSSAGGISCLVNSAPVIENTIIAFNAGNGSLLCDDTSVATLSCCDVYGNGGGDWIGCIADQLGINGNIAENPLFCDGEGGDLTLRSDSPCAEENNPLCGQIGLGQVNCEPPTSLDDPTVPAPVTYDLHPCYPNPFNPSTTISYDLPEPARVTLHVYDVSGRLIRVLRSGQAEQTGRHQVVWDGRDESGRGAASGVYVTRLWANEFHRSHSMVLLK